MRFRIPLCVHSFLGSEQGERKGTVNKIKHYYPFDSQTYSADSNSRAHVKVEIAATAARATQVNHVD